MSPPEGLETSSELGIRPSAPVADGMRRGGHHGCARIWDIARCSRRIRDGGLARGVFERQRPTAIKRLDAGAEYEPA